MVATRAEKQFNAVIIIFIGRHFRAITIKSSKIQFSHLRWAREILYENCAIYFRFQFQMGHCNAGRQILFICPLHYVCGFAEHDPKKKKKEELLSNELTSNLVRGAAPSRHIAIDLCACKRVKTSQMCACAADRTRWNRMKRENDFWESERRLRHYIVLFTSQNENLVDRATKEPKHKSQQ